MKQSEIPLWRKSMLQHLNLTDIEQALYEIVDNGDVFGYESDESGYYQEYKELFDELAFGASELLDALSEHDVQEHWDDMTVALLGETHSILGFDAVEADYFHIVDPFCEQLAVQAAQKRLERLTKAELIRTFRSVLGMLVSFFDLKAANDCLTAIVQELDEKSIIMERQMKRLLDTENAKE